MVVKNLLLGNHFAGDIILDEVGHVFGGGSFGSGGGSGTLSNDGLSSLVIFNHCVASKNQGTGE